MTYDPQSHEGFRWPTGSGEGTYSSAGTHTDGAAITHPGPGPGGRLADPCPIVPGIVAALIPGAVEGLGLPTAARIVTWIIIGIWTAIIVGTFILATDDSATPSAHDHHLAAVRTLTWKGD